MTSKATWVTATVGTDGYVGLDEEKSSIKKPRNGDRFIAVDKAILYIYYKGTWWPQVPDPPTPQYKSDVTTVAVTEPSLVWESENKSGYPQFVQTFNDEGDEMRADVTEDSTVNFTPIRAEFTGDAVTGLMVNATTCKQYVFENQKHIVIDMNSEEFFAVQVYNDEEGMIMGDIQQQGGIITIDYSAPKTGRVVIVKPSKVVEFIDQKTWMYVHNLGRFVGVQIYFDSEGQAMADVHNLDMNTVQVEFNVKKSGHMIIV